MEGIQQRCKSCRFFLQFDCYELYSLEEQGMRAKSRLQINHPWTSNQVSVQESPMVEDVTTEPGKCKIICIHTR